MLAPKKKLVLNQETLWQLTGRLYADNLMTSFDPGCTGCGEQCSDSGCDDCSEGPNCSWLLACPITNITN